MANPGMPVCKSPSGQKTDSDCKIVELISLKPCHPTEIQHVLNMFCIYNKFTVTKKLSYDRKMRKILKQTCFPIPLLIPNAISFHHWHDLAWLHPHDWHVCPKWHDTHCMNSGHQIIVVQSVSKLDLTPSNQKQKTWSWLDHQSLLDDPLTCSSSSPSTTSSSSSSESGFVTWMQKRPLMQTQTWPSPHIMFQWILIFLWCGTKMSTVYFDRKNSETKKCSSAFNYQSSNDPPFLISIDGRNDSPIAATNWNILLEMILLLLCTNWQGSWTCAFAMNNSWLLSILTMTWHDHSKPWLDITRLNFLKTYPSKNVDKKNFQNTAINQTK